MFVGMLERDKELLGALCDGTRASKSEINERSIRH